jgi:hypothetical protein
MEKDYILIFIIVFGIICISVSLGLILTELYHAHKYCHSQDGKYKLQINKEGINHLCNDLKISRYNNDGETVWDFEKNRNFTISIESITNSKE